MSVGKYEKKNKKHRNVHTVTVFTVTFQVNYVTLMSNGADIFSLFA